LKTYQELKYTEIFFASDKHGVLLNSLRSVVKSVAESFGVRISLTEEAYFENLFDRIEKNLIIQSKGVLHIGASFGQEANFYQSLNAKVLWIEAIPLVYEKLHLKCSLFQNQFAINALLGDANREKVDFYLASNNFESSSIFQFGRDFRSNKIMMNDQVELPMFRLDSLEMPIPISNFGHWVIDVQGAELDVLKGCGNLIKDCQSLKIEVSTKEIYAQGTRWEELKSFLNSLGFLILWEPKEASHEDVIFINTKRH